MMDKHEIATKVGNYGMQKYVRNSMSDVEDL